MIEFLDTRIGTACAAVLWVSVFLWSLWLNAKADEQLEKDLEELDKTFPEWLERRRKERNR